MIMKRSNLFIHFTFSLFIIELCTIFTGCSYISRKGIQVYKENPSYWEFKGKPVLLLGGSDDDNLFNNLDLMGKNLETLEGIGGNYIRCTLSCRDKGNVWPYVKSDGKYDLDKFNPVFCDRLETCIREAEIRDIIVQIEFWATFDYYREMWQKNPFNPANNKNYTTETTHLVTKWNHHPAESVQPFFRSPPELNNDKILLRYQEAFVKKVLDVTLSYSNVLYCLDNETEAPAEWVLYWGEFIKKEAKKRGKKINLTEMWNPWNITDPEHAITYENPELFFFTDISQNNWQEGQIHYDRLIWYRQNLDRQKNGIQPINNVKVYSRRSGGKPNDTAISIDRWWQNIFAGCASTRFHRPTGGIGLSSKAQKVIRTARFFTSSFDIFACEPRPDLLSDRQENEAYCLANPGHIYAVYFPRGGQVNLEVEKTKKDYRIRWFDTDSGSFFELKPAHIEYSFTRKAEGKRFMVLKSPSTNKTWLVLIERM